MSIIKSSDAKWLIRKLEQEIVEISWNIKYAKNNFPNSYRKMAECETAMHENENRKRIIAALKNNNIEKNVVKNLIDYIFKEGESLPQWLLKKIEKKYKL